MAYFSAMYPGALFNRYLAIAALLLLPACSFLSNRDYVQQHSTYRGIRRVAVFIQRWPVYLQLPQQNDAGADFIKKETPFTGPWKHAGLINARAVDIRDIDDEVMGELLEKVLTEKGYQPFLSGVFPPSPGPITVGEMMSKYQAFDSEVDAFLFCFYSPTIFVAEAQGVPKEKYRSYGIGEIIRILQPGREWVIWSGPRADLAPRNSISHAFIYVSMTMFRALDWRPMWETADSQIGGRLRVEIAQCPPEPTEKNYWADAAIIQRLMTDNLRCRLRHMVPDAF
jgi:hypothetical protein